VVGDDEEMAAVQIWPEVPYCLHHLQQLVSGHAIVPLRPIQGVTVVSHNAIAPDTYVAGIGVHNESLLGIGVGQDRGFGEGCLELGEGCSTGVVPVE